MINYGTAHQSLRDDVLGELCQSPQDAGYVRAHLKYFYTNAHSIKNKQEKLEALALSQSYNIVSITEAWWKEFYDWCVMMYS